MNRLALPALLLITCGVLLAQEEEERPYRFFLDGEKTRLAVISLNGDFRRHAPGDLVEIGDHMKVTLAGPGRYEFTREEPLLYLDRGEGRKLVGVTVTEDVNPLAALTPEEIGGLRGVVLQAMPAGIEKLLAQLDSAVVTISVIYLDAPKFPALPPGLQRLTFSSLGEGFQDFSPLSKLTALRVLTTFEGSVPIHLLKGAKNLRVLQAPSCFIESPADFAGFKEMRALDISGTRGLDDASFLAGMKHLARLYVERTELPDLLPLSNHLKIRDVKAHSSKVAAMPQGRLPALKWMDVTGAEVSAEDADDFRERHPECRFRYSWTGLFREEVPDCDRLNYTVWDHEGQEKTLFTIEGERAAAAARALVVNDRASGGRCACGGWPEFRFYLGEKLLAAVGYGHGHNMRWWGWHGDATLTDESARFFTDLLAEHGFDGEKKTFERNLEGRVTWVRRREIYRSILGDETWAALDGLTWNQCKRYLETHPADPVVRARMHFRLLGSHQGAWDDDFDLDVMLRCSLLDEAEPKVVAEAVTGLLGDTFGMNGIARWIYYENEELLPEALAEVLPAVTRHGLGCPLFFNRLRTMKKVTEKHPKLAVTVLREVLAGKIAIRPFMPGEERSTTKPEGYRRRAKGVDAADTDRAAAAFLLAKLGDRTALSQIRKLRKKATKADAELIDQAIELLTE